MPKEKKSKDKKPTVPKFYRDTIQHREEHGGLYPGGSSPICAKCGLHEAGARHPFLEYGGSDDPLITFVLDSVSKPEDEEGEMGTGGPPELIRKLMVKEYGATEAKALLRHVRWTATTRCASRIGKRPNYATKGNWCRNFLVEDLRLHPPRLIVPIGTAALGALSHKSNANDWSGRLLTYRGWPDDWISDLRFHEGHPVHGPVPDYSARIPLYPLQAPRLVYATQNKKVFTRWLKHLFRAFKLAGSGIEPLSYDRPWYRISDDPHVIEESLQWLIDHPGTIVTYDTETTGLRQFVSGAAIVFMMFRWDQDGEPKSIGFPWSYAGSPMQAWIPHLTPTVLKALYASRLRGHNLTFDILFTAATLAEADLDRLAQAMDADTWHMLYTLLQKRGSLGLELVTYDWCPDLAGYEEEMTLLIEKYRTVMHPEEGGHYANCPRELWDSHLKPYVMGDVESCHQIAFNVEEKLEKTEGLQIPMAHPTLRGKFRLMQTPNRHFVYQNVMAPAARLLTKMMGRGMHVDMKELEAQEDLFPKQVLQHRNALRNVDEKIIQWCEQNEATESTPEKKWELDLENKEQLKTILFRLLDLPVKRLTKTGQKELGEKLDDYSKEQLIEWAACDKYTLNSLAVDHPQVRPLQEYRRIYKQYTTYIRPLRNLFTKGIDKKQRVKGQHLMPDGRVHTQFLLTGTRTGRLSSREPNLQNLVKDGRVKKIYVSRFGSAGCMYQADLSQIELRIMAAVCGDETMVKAYWNKEDLHAITTNRVYGIPMDKFSKEYTQMLDRTGRDTEKKDLELKRRVGKTVNFLTGYGGGAFGLQTTLANAGIYLTLQECEHIIESFFDAYPALRKYLGFYKRFIMDNGCAVSMLGRVRWFEEVFSTDKEAISKALRAGCNHLIQSTASDMMLVCLCVIEHLMREEGLKSILISTVHDSLLIDAVRDELPMVHKICTDVIENIPEVLRLFLGDKFDTSWMIVPFGGDYEVGLNYLNSKKISLDEEPNWPELLSA